MSTPFQFKWIEIRNFMSVGNSVQQIELNEPGTVMVTGENLDNGGSNGAGKTTIINAICYALYNKPFDNISLQRLINSTNNLKNTLMEVKLCFDKDNQEYEIYRARGEEYRIEIRRDGEDITPGKGVTECDVMIEDIVGISYDLFTKTVIFSGNAPAFLQLPVSQQRNQIEELFNITMLSEKAQLLKEKIRQTESDIRVAEAVCAQQQVAIDVHTKHVREAQERVTRWERKRVTDIAEAEATLQALSTIDFEAEKKLHAEWTQLKEESAYLAACLAPKRKDFQQLTKDVERLLGEQAHLVDAKCPYCTQSFADAKTKLQEVERQIDERGARLITLGNTEDDLGKLSEVDWVVEAILKRETKTADSGVEV